MDGHGPRDVELYPACEGRRLIHCNAIVALGNAPPQTVVSGYVSGLYVVDMLFRRILYT